MPGLGSPPVVFTPVVYYGQVANLSSLGSSAQVLSPTNGTFFRAAPRLPSACITSIFRSNGRLVSKPYSQIGYVGNFDRHAPEGGFTNGGTNLNIIPYQAYANPANVFNGSEINQNFLRSPYPGMGTMNYATNDLSDLNYHGLSVSAQRRLSHGLVLWRILHLFEGSGNLGQRPVSHRNADHQRSWPDCNSSQQKTVLLWTDLHRSDQRSDRQLFVRSSEFHQTKAGQRLC